jgi:hypothetical protein
MRPRLDLPWLLFGFIRCAFSPNGVVTEQNGNQQLKQQRIIDAAAIAILSQQTSPESNIRSGVRKELQTIIVTRTAPAQKRLTGPLLWRTWMNNNVQQRWCALFGQLPWSRANNAIVVSRLTRRRGDKTTTGIA